MVLPSPETLQVMSLRVPLAVRTAVATTLSLTEATSMTLTSPACSPLSPSRVNCPPRLTCQVISLSLPAPVLTAVTRSASEAETGCMAITLVAPAWLPLSPRRVIGPAPNPSFQEMSFRFPPPSRTAVIVRLRTLVTAIAETAPA